METEKKPILKIHDLHKSYDGHRVLKGLGMEVYPGEIIGYIGPNGAGKSTTVKIILGLIRDYEGEVSLFGKNIKEDNSYKARIGYVPEAADLYESLTAREYLNFSAGLYNMDPDYANKKAEALSELFGFKDYMDTALEGFSKGMRQKVLLISAMLHDPEILFLDEPLNGIDTNTVSVIKEVLAHLAAEGVTIFYSSHIMEVVEKISSRIMLLSDGVVAAEGTFESLKAQNNDKSLEEIFNNLTGFSEGDERAQKIVDIIRDRGLER